MDISESVKEIDRLYAAGQTQSASDLVGRLAVQAVMASRVEEVRQQLRAADPARWQKTKGAFSGALKLAQHLRKGHELPLPLRERKAFRIGGRYLSGLTSDDLRDLASPHDGDTPISSLVNQLYKHLPKHEEKVLLVTWIVRSTCAEAEAIRQKGWSLNDLRTHASKDDLRRYIAMAEQEAVSSDPS